MCSKCFRDSHPAGADHQETKPDRAASVFAAVSSSPPLKKKIKTSVPAAIGSSSSDAAAAAVDDTSSSAANTTQQKQQEEEDLAKKTATKTANRCMTCRKKVGLTVFQYRCGETFCGSHRYADAHACGFDYKAAGREQIAKQNPLVVAAKLAKI
ncbi:hypothetical protein QOZ80_3BG0258130 [Eleusine coracana subsp. coracana]|nr:hypothetical protein QOZ80_3BG0258130 [Eleusine coracana subsp. coracana]